MELTIIILYSFCLLYIFLFSIGQLHLTWIYTRKRKITQITLPTNYFPNVTIQLPIYNEKYVVERLIEAVCKLDYPKENIEIQILDDSTDETTSLIISKIEQLRSLALDIKLIHRNDRKGFKAGALAYATATAKGEFIAIFDADFIPESNFLQKTIPHFQDTNIAVVQTRWAHINKEYSLLTQLQAFGLDAHFTIEQSARNIANSFINFNGTCGVWRKTAIADAGGWTDDTLTEDLDLSYRAQLKGWKFKFLQEVSTPGELPVIMQAIKSQQYRWNKGGAETARKNFGSVLHSKAKASLKMHAFFHLFNSSIFVCLLVASLLSIPMLTIKANNPSINWLFNIGIVFLIGFFSIAIFYWVATKQLSKNPWLVFLRTFPAFITISMGLSLHNGIAVLEGLLGRKTPFIRTPKFNVTNKGDSWKSNTYIKSRFTLLTFFEGLLCCYFAFGIAYGISLGDTGLLIFHAMLSIGFGLVFYFSVKTIATS
jgi:cellulose synthase/poly-beta-1,6-N-acetylglucosamine synthase-like glycosyltransferase